MLMTYLPQGENYAITKPRWEEWDSELPYNKNRTCVFYGGSLNIFQLGSNTLGRASDEDAEKVGGYMCLPGAMGRMLFV